ncbi:efflux RND transporter permease subunit [Parvularcula lutaonensis]|uniref:Efflux RND transporter permease subunit n=1 Tax=Parvularcula lutaonensis TaxID=491923 RepID=A0ABV7MAP0_9PROT|nr:efflux RND transporter permease subunit [Parvularcula lutaonensis]GGY37744.1 cation efflux system protein [Parvularcula lutaonensis]
MLQRLIAFSLAQRAFVVAMALGLAVAGTWAALRLPIDAFPEIAPPQVKIIMKAPGMTPAEVEARVVRALERELLGIPGQDVMRARTKYAIADITIDFRPGTDIYWARQQVAERVNAVTPQLPTTVEGGMAPISTALSELFMFTIDGDGASLEERRSLLDWVIRPALRTVPGVADVNALGGRVRAVEIRPDDAAMMAAGVSLEDLRNAVTSNNSNDGAGRVSSGEESLIVRSVGALQSPATFERLVVRNTDQGPVRLGDVARVSHSSLTRYGSVTHNGEGETVEGIVVALRGADARRVVSGVEERLAELAPSLPEGVSINVFYNRSDLIEKATGTVLVALVIASVLVIALLGLFLNDLRASLVVTLVMPLSAFATFLLMQVFGMSANLMSLGGLAIAIGMIVDSAIVVTENAVERLKQGSVTRLHAIFNAASDVAAPTLAGTLIICLVFSPLLTLEGLEGKLFAPVAATIIFALGSAVLLAIIVIPVLASFVLQPGKGREAALMQWLTPRYGMLLERVLERPVMIYGIAGVSTVLAALAYLGVGKTFMPTMNEGTIVMQAASLPSISLEQSEDDDLMLQRALLEAVPEVEQIISRVGSDEIGLDPMGLNESDMFFKLAPRGSWRGPDTDWLVGEMRSVMSNYPGIETSFTQPIEMRVSEMLTGSRGDVTLKIFGADPDQLAALATRAEQLLAGVRGAAEVFTTSDDLAEYVTVTVDHAKAGQLGLDTRLIQDKLRATIEGSRLDEVIEPGRRTPVILRTGLDGTADALKAIRITLPDGRSVPLEDVASIGYEEGLASTIRENASRYAAIQAFVSGRDLVGFVSDARQAITASLELPPGYRLEWGGEFENQQRASRRLGLMVPVALLLIFAVLFITLRSLRQAMLILFNIPFALVGGILALWISGQYLSVPASMGFIALLGIAVLNGLVLVSCFNDLLASGHGIAETVKIGARRRLRPVLMTATTGAFGLLPLLFATGPGAEIQKPLAIVVIGGLTSSTFLTLFLLPALFKRFGLGSTAPDELERELQWQNPYAS